ncbi:MAG: aminopeptidase P family protein [Candidatus Omnitrophica bacterium]|nr:aminopeptidase P family protein [Candidatus Omnitrophota bacterium]
MNASAPYEARQKKLAERVSSEGLEALWVTNLVNIRYLTGFTGSYAQLLITPEGSYFFSDGRYREQADKEVKGCAVRIFVGMTWLEILAEEISDHDWKTMGIEAAHLNVSTFEEIKKLPSGKGSVDWRPTVSWVEELRVIKDESEKETLRRSSQVVDRVFAALIQELEEGVSEREILRKMMNLLWEEGATGPSFDPIVLFGARSSLPHGKPGDARLNEGDWVLLDFGAVVDGYCSDCTRTFVFGDPDDLQRERHALVHEAQKAGIAAARAGVAGKDADAASRRVLEEAGLAEAFMHGLGHGVGLEIHEAPRLASSSKDVLKSGAVVTVEPGIYIPGWGGIRIEDAVVVGNGDPEPLTFCNHSICPL